MVKIANIMFYIFYQNKKKFTKENPRKFFFCRKQVDCKIYMTI